MRLVILKTRQTGSTDRKASGAISKKQTQTPNAQYRLMSLEDFLFMTRIISGMFHNGNIIAAMSAIFCAIIIIVNSLFISKLKNQNSKLQLKTQKVLNFELWFCTLHFEF